LIISWLVWMILIRIIIGLIISWLVWITLIRIIMV